MGLREWEKHEFVPRPDDVFQERLYCVMWIDENGDWYYADPQTKIWSARKSSRAFKRAIPRVAGKGYIPSNRIEDGEKTAEPIRNRVGDTGTSCLTSSATSSRITK